MSDINTTLQTLGKYKTAIDASINRYCDALLESTKHDFTSYSYDITKTYCDMVRRGGKRLRGSLVMAAYDMTGGTDKTMIVEAARVIEMFHAYLLIMDDIADQSDMRRGGPTAHRILQDYHRTNNLHGDSAHFGEAIAMHIGLLGSHLAMGELGRLGLDDTTKLMAMNSLNDTIVTTVHGQFNDIINESLRDVDEPQVERTLTWKTAYYSFLNPLQFGAILAKTDSVDLDYLNDYAIHMGLAFQIVDDIIGTFGDSQASGKSTQDDLKEGKATFLTARALQRATPEQKHRLLQHLGNPRLSAADAEECMQIIEQSGALDYTQKLAKHHAQHAAQALNDLPKHWKPESITFLRGLAGYVTSRTA